MNGVIGIKSNNLKTLILDVYAYRDKLAKILDELEKDFYNCKQYYKSDDGEQMAKKFDSMVMEYKSVISLVKNYADDLEKVLQMHKSAEVSASNIFVNNTLKVVELPIKK